MATAQPIPLACPDCAAQMPDTAAFCPGCGRPMVQGMSHAVSRATSSSIAGSDLGGERSDQRGQSVANDQQNAHEHAQGQEEALRETKAHGKVGIFSENIAGALAYMTFIPAVVFLLVAPYNKNRFVRFHSIQSVSLWVAGIVIAVALKVSGLVLFHVPMLGPLLLVLLWGMIGLAVVLIWLVLVVKALQGEMFELPFLGRFAKWNADPQ